jgi:hypothetical protein
MPIREIAARRRSRWKMLGRAADNRAIACQPASGGRSQRGGATLKSLIWLVILIAMIYAGIKVVPVLVAEYQFQDFMQSTARFASVNRNTTAGDISKSVLDEAQKQSIPLKAEDVHVTADSGLINISADYTVTVDLNVYQLTLNFHPSAGNKPLT